MSEATLSKPKKKTTKLSENEVLELLYSKVGKPENYLKVSCVNVFSNFYRVNIWHSINHDFLKNAALISASYFFKIVDKDIVIY